MSIINSQTVLNNIIALGVILWIFFMIYSQMNNAKARDTMERIKGLFGGKKE